MGERLNTIPISRIVTAYDLFDRKHKRNLKNFKFRVSVYGILMNKNMILVNKNPLLDKFGLPGGGVKIGEKLEKALKREFKEETGLSIKVNKLFCIEENLFTYEDEDAHGILIFYLVNKVGGKISPNHDDSEEVKFLNIYSAGRYNIQRYCWGVIQKLKKEKFKKT